MGIKDNFSQAVKELWKKDGQSGEPPKDAAGGSTLDQYLNQSGGQTIPRVNTEGSGVPLETPYYPNPNNTVNRNAATQENAQDNGVNRTAQQTQQGTQYAPQGGTQYDPTGRGDYQPEFEKPYYRDPQPAPNNQDNQGFGQGAQSYNQGAQNYNQGAQNYNQGTQNYNQGAQNYNQGTQNYNQGAQNYNQGAQNYNQGMQNYNQGAQGYDQGGYRQENPGNYNVNRSLNGGGSVPPEQGGGLAAQGGSDTDEVTVISKNTNIDGNVHSLANMHIDGNIKGNVETTKNVEMTGKIVGDITCNNAGMNSAAMQGNVSLKGRMKMDRDTILIGDLSSQYADINGRIRGKLDIVGKAELKRDAIVFGDINASTIAVTDGAIIQGYVNTTFLSKEDSRNVFPEAISLENKNNNQ